MMKLKKKNALFSAPIRKTRILKRDYLLRDGVGLGPF